VNQGGDALTVLEGQARAADGERIAWTRYTRPGRAAALVVCPGFFKSKDTPTFRRLCRALAGSRDVLAMDFRGHGRSSGRYTFSAREPQDLHAMLDLARARYARVGVMGFSLGGAIAIAAASHRPGDVAALVAVSAPSEFRRIEFRWWTPQAIRTGLRGLEPGAGCRPAHVWMAKERPIERLPYCRGVPIHLIHGTRDAIVAEAHAHRLFPAAADPKTLTLIPGGSHAEALFRDDPAGFLAVVEPWLAARLPA
jgi:pimeloyl-ACP methyl ester carboxylesterase